jgi:hypothetical protein
MNEIEKLRVLLPHWIEHNAEHSAEFREWAERARQAEHGDAAWEVRVAAENLEAANDALEAALEKLGGPLERHHRG